MGLDPMRMSRWRDAGERVFALTPSESEAVMGIEVPSHTGSPTGKLPSAVHACRSKQTALVKLSRVLEIQIPRSYKSMWRFVGRNARHDDDLNHTSVRSSRRKGHIEIVSGSDVGVTPAGSRTWSP